jgi:hypothetical protein
MQVRHPVIAISYNDLTHQLGLDNSHRKKGVLFVEDLCFLAGFWQHQLYEPSRYGLSTKITRTDTNGTFEAAFFCPGGLRTVGTYLRGFTAIDGTHTKSR